MTRKTCKLLMAVAAQAVEPRVAVIGNLDGRTAMSLLRQIAWPPPVMPGLPVMLVLLWDATAVSALPRHWRTGRQQRACYPYQMLRTVVAGDGTRAAWRAEVVRLVEGGAAPFSLIAHGGPGTAAERLADLETLAPLMDDRTLVVVCDAETRPGAGFVRRLVLEHGWHGVPMGEVIFLAKPALSVHNRGKETTDADVHEPGDSRRRAASA